MNTPAPTPAPTPTPTTAPAAHHVVGGSAIEMPATTPPRDDRTDERLSPPAFHVHERKVVVPSETAEPWKELVDSYRTQIETNLSSVGRIQQDSLVLGTGFLVARNIVMTARHVAEAFTMNIDGVAKVRVGWKPLIDFDGEIPPTGAHTHGDAGAGREQAHNHAICGCGEIESVIHMDDELDLALLRISFTSTSAMPNWQRPQPLTLTSDMPAGEEAERKIYLIGFPRPDGTELPEAQKKLFGDALGVKRVQPGRITVAPTAGREFVHDASTLRGNSGSCVIDAKMDRVIGLHFRGSRERPGEAGFNRAIAFWLLSEEEKAPLRRAGIDLA